MMLNWTLLRLLPRLAVGCGLGLALAGCVISGTNRTPSADLPNRGERLVAMCQSDYRAGRVALAAAACRRAVELNPTQPRLLHAVGRLMLALGEPRESAAAYRRLLALDRADPTAWHGLGKAHAARGQYAEAAVAFEAALALQPSEPRYHNALAVTKDMAGDHAGAQAIYARGLALDPTHPLLSRNQQISADLQSGDGTPADLRFAFKSVPAPRSRAPSLELAGLAPGGVRPAPDRHSPAAGWSGKHEPAGGAPSDLLRHLEVPVGDTKVVQPDAGPTIPVDGAAVEAEVYALRLGLFGSLNGAWDGRTLIRAVAGDLLGDIDLVIRRTTGHVRFRAAYLLRTEAIDTKSAANALCAGLRARDVVCRVIGLDPKAT